MTRPYITAAATEYRLYAQFPVCQSLTGVHDSSLVGLYKMMLSLVLRDGANVVVIRRPDRSIVVTYAAGEGVHFYPRFTAERPASRLP